MLIAFQLQQWLHDPATTLRYIAVLLDYCERYVTSLVGNVERKALQKNSAEHRAANWVIRCVHGTAACTKTLSVSFQSGANLGLGKLGSCLGR